MDTRKQSFLTEVLGESGAQALIKAAERSEAFEQALLPRAILAWVQAASMYEGEIPGSEGSLSFQKSENGFTGDISLPAGVYTFHNASVFHLAASVAVALGVEKAETEDVRQVDLERLGKSIDILAKARRASMELAKKEKFCPGCTFHTDKHRKGCEKIEDLEKAAIPAHLPKDCCWCDNHATHFDATKDTYKPALGEAKHPPDTACAEHKHHLGDNAKPILRMVKDELVKAKEGPGHAAAPLAPAAPQAPTSTAPQPTPTTLPKNPGTAQMAKPAKAANKATTKITKAEANGACRSCGQHQFGDDPFVFRGCMCFRAIASGVNVQAMNKNEVILEMDARIWDPAAIVTFLESIGRVR